MREECITKGNSFIDVIVIKKASMKDFDAIQMARALLKEEL